MPPSPFRQFALAATVVAVVSCDRAESHRLTLLGWGGQMVTIDVERDSVIATRNITDSPSLGAIDSPQWDGTPVDDVAYDAARRVVFLVLPDRAREESDKPKRYRIVSASMPGLERIAEYASPDSMRPALFFDTHGGKLLAEWYEGDTVTVRSLTSPALTVERTLTQRPDERANISLLFPMLIQSGQTYLGTSSQTADGKRLVDTDGTIEIGADSMIAKRHRVEVSPQRRTELAKAAGTPEDRLWLWVASNAGDNLLVVAVPPDTQRRATQVFIHNLDGAGKEFPVVTAPEGRRVLFGDARHFLVQEVDGSMRRPMSDVKTTGRVILYDGATGSVVNEFTDPRLAGSYEIVTPICASADNQRVYVRLANAALGVIRFATKDVVVLPAIADVGAVCMWQ